MLSGAIDVVKKVQSDRRVFAAEATVGALATGAWNPLEGLGLLEYLGLGAAAGLLFGLVVLVARAQSRPDVTFGNSDTGSRFRATKDLTSRH